jgi:hypothetical protein
MDYEFDRSVPSGGRARGGRGSIHLSFRSGSRGGGARASGAFDYISRSGRYDEPDRDEALYTESDHMPSWAEENPATYWDAADVYERANGRLYVSADFALPRDLDPEDQIELAHDFAQALTADEHLPYTLAIHAGRDDDGEEHNPHAHLMFSERRNDGIERSREDWFRRADSEHPEHGGAPKSRTFHGRDWIEHARERWADLTNTMLERKGRDERVDHRSYVRQGIDREPGRHYGPAAAHIVGRGHDHERLDDATNVVEQDGRMREIEHEIARLEVARESVLRDGLAEDDRPPDRRDYSYSSGPDHSDDSSRGR